LLSPGTLWREALWGSVKGSRVRGAAALLAGLVLHVLAVALRDAGPVWGAVSLRGNGAAVVLPLAVAALVVTEVFCVRQRAWLGLALVPVGLVAGLFVVLGGI
jgi:hypothetical protein